MSYTIRKFNGTELVVLRDGTIDTSTSVALVGRNYTGYGELQNQNFVYLLENFANEAPPSTPVIGQTWFSTGNNNLHVYDGTKWSIVGTATVAGTAPENPPSGALWFNSDEGKLYCWTGVWIAIGPENVEGFGKTKAESTSLLSDVGSRFPVIIIYVNDSAQAIYSSTAFTIASIERPQGFIELIAGLNFANRSTAPSISGNLKGTAEKTTILETTRLINGIGFNGSQDITITAATPFPLTKGDYIVGNNFNGSSNVTWSVDATSNNTIGTIVARDSAGDFSAGTISADLIGNVQGNVTATTGTSTFNILTANQFIGASLSGNANTATRLRTARSINGVDFDGTLDITVSVSGLNVTGSRLANNVVNSNLSTLGTLTELRVEDAGISIGNILDLAVNSGVATITADNTQGLYLSVQDPAVAGNYSSIEFIAAAKNLAQGGESLSAIIPRNVVNLGDTYSPFNKTYSTTFIGGLQGNSDTATSSITSNNIAGGAAGAIPYQSANGITAFVPAGVSGQVLRSGGSGQPVWGAIAFSTLTRGTYLTGANYDGIVDTTWAVDATSANTANKIVARDSNGNFSAGTITATLNGNITGNASTATRLQTGRTINGVVFDGTSNIDIPLSSATDPSKVLKTGDTMTGFLSLNANPTLSLHAATKQYVDDADYVITYGNTVFSTSSFTNQVGSWNNNFNYFDVFPPAGKTMSNLVAFIPSIAEIHFSGGVDGNDSMRCTWSNLGDRIRVYVQNTEQRSTPAANYLAIWR
jgi:hypothetical protein